MNALRPRRRNAARCRRLRLAMAAIKAAKEIGYRKILLDTAAQHAHGGVKFLPRTGGFTEALNYYQTRSRARCSWRSISTTGREEEAATKTCRTSSISTAPGRARCRKSTRLFQPAESPADTGMLWIGCSDSRVPANQIVGLLPARSSSTQRRQPGSAYRPQLPVGHPVRRRCAGKVSTSWSSATTTAAASAPALHKTRVGIVDFWLAQRPAGTYQTPHPGRQPAGRTAP